MATASKTDSRVPLTIRVAPDIHNAARHKLVDDGLTFQDLCAAAIGAYVAGEWTPARAAAGVAADNRQDET